MTLAARSYVLDIVPSRAAVIRCFAEPRALDTFPPGAGLARVARDELWLLGGASARNDLAARAKSYFAGVDPDGTVVDQSDGWSAWTVTGPDSTAILKRLSAIRVPTERPAFVQGAVAEVPAKVLVQADRLLLFAPAPFAHHVSNRMLAACADLGARLAQPEELAIERNR
jgi:sarcosine oxidase gamma subunit